MTAATDRDDAGKFARRIAVKLVPILAGYFPVAVFFAVIAREAGLTTTEIVAMSLFVFSGAAQIASVPLIAAGEPLWYIFLVMALLGMRHIAFSATLAPSAQGMSRKELGVFAWTLTDEVFAIHTLDVERGTFRKYDALAVGVAGFTIWVLSTLVGCLAGAIAAASGAIRLEFALTAMFAGIVFLHMKSRVAGGGSWGRQVLLTAGVAAATVSMSTLGSPSLAIVMPALVVGAWCLIAPRLKERP